MNSKAKLTKLVVREGKEDTIILNTDKLISIIDKKITPCDE
jgi:hypothetical protein